MKAKSLHFVLALSFAFICPAFSQTPSLTILSLSYNGSNNISLSWSTQGAVLQSAYFANGPWALIPQATSPWPVSTIYSRQFFRLLISGATNPAPVTIPDTYSVLHDHILTVLPSGVLGNDYDTNGLPISATEYSPPSHGTLLFNSIGSFYYTPDAGFVGTDSFMYLAENSYVPGGPATVTIMVTNTAPVAANDQYGVQAGQVLSVPAHGILANDSDADGDSIYATAVTQPASGTLALQTDGSFTYTPNVGFSGTDSFTYTATDLLATSSVAQVMISVHGTNLPPVAAGDSYSVRHDSNLSVPAPGVLANDSDPDGDPIHAILVSGTANGTLMLHGNGSFSYLPNNGFTGTDQFSYAASDGLSNSAPAVVTISVTNGVPSVPSLAYSVKPNTTLSNGPASLLATATDPDGDDLTVQIISGTSFGAVTVNADGSFIYQPPTNFVGTETFTFVVSDGITNSPVATVTISVTNHAPVAVADNYGLCATKLPQLIQAPGVLANDFDVDGDTLTAVLQTAPAHGTVTLNSDGSFQYFAGTGFSGSDSFTYSAFDGTAYSAPAVVMVNVFSNCLPPLPVPDNYQTLPNETLVVAAAQGVLGNDIDPQGSPMTAVKVTDVSNGSLALSSDGSFTYTPNPGWSGIDSFTYYPANGPITGAVVGVTINVADSAPVIIDDTYTVHANTVLTELQPGVLDNDDDPDNGDDFTAMLVTGPKHGTVSLDPSGAFIYTPAAYYTGSDAFFYSATDGALTSSVARVTIIVSNTAPVAGDDDYGAAVNTGSGSSSGLSVPAPGVLGNDVDDDGDPITAVLYTPPAFASAFQLFPDGSFTYTPVQGYSGPDSFKYRAFDGMAYSALATVSINVTAAPLVRDDYYVFTPGQQLVVPAADGVLANDFAPGAGAFFAAAVGPAVPGLVVNADGSLVYNAPSNSASVVAKYVASLNGIGSVFQGAVVLAVVPPYLYLDRMSFDGGTRVHADDTNILFDWPQWVDINHNGVIDPDVKGERGWPYSCPRDTKLKASASFAYTDADAYKGKQVLIRGTLFNDGTAMNIMIPSTVAKQDEKRKLFTIPTTTADNKLPDTVDMINPLQIKWEYSIDKGVTWWFCGTSVNRLYVTYAATLTTPLYETMVYYGCTKGAGLKDPDKLGKAIWENFAHDPAKPTAMAARADGKPLTYYKDWNVFQPGADFDTTAVPGLLKLTDGRCGTWALFMVRCFQAQGLTTAKKYGIWAGGWGILVKNWNFAGPAGVLVITPAAQVKTPHPADPKFTFENSPDFNKTDTFWPNVATADKKNVWKYNWTVNPAQVDYVDGSAQNNTNPRGLFTDHAIVSLGGKWYDPSYGGGPFATLLELQNAELDGYCYGRQEQDLLNNNTLSAAYPILKFKKVDPKVREIKTK